MAKTGDGKSTSSDCEIGVVVDILKLRLLMLLCFLKEVSRGGVFAVRGVLASSECGAWPWRGLF